MAVVSNLLVLSLTEIHPIDSNSRNESFWHIPLAIQESGHRQTSTGPAVRKRSWGTPRKKTEAVPSYPLISQEMRQKNNILRVHVVARVFNLLILGCEKKKP